MQQMGSDEIEPTDPANDLDGPLDLDELQKRLRATSALKEFGQLLHLLATRDNVARLETASTSFLASLRKVEGVQISDREAAALGKLIVHAGTLFLDAERAKCIRAVVMETQTPIQRVTQLLRADLDPKSHLWAAALTDVSESVAVDLPQLLRDRKPGDEFNGKILTEADIALLWSQYHILQADTQQRRANLERTRSGLLEALNEMDKAHMALFYGVQSNTLEFPEINRYLDQMEELLRLFQAVRGT
jgi:hypothetical protein